MGLADGQRAAASGGSAAASWASSWMLVQLGCRIEAVAAAGGGAKVLAVSKAWKLAGCSCSFLETSWLAQKVRFPTLSSLLYS